MVIDEALVWELLDVAEDDAEGPAQVVARTAKASEDGCCGGPAADRYLSPAIPGRRAAGPGSLLRHLDPTRRQRENTQDPSRFAPAPPALRGGQVPGLARRLGSQCRTGNG
ncbi:hypothetical protein ABZV15_38230 [Streptomyces sp. NPDC005246]|uniref:hypothetical protein n=1 Tax=Streptomyces sp. NPDC005246 TaxID=3156716 RepID=UPI0033A3791B